MKLNFSNILILSAALLAAVACNKEQRPGHDTTGYAIEFSATEAGVTKAMLDETSFAKAGNLIKIYDIYTPKGSNTSEIYIDDKIKSNGPGNAIWPFVDQRYNWTPDGSHKFFGWLAEDKNMSEDNTPEGFFGTGFGYANQVITIPTTTLNASTSAFDFMYSNVHVRDLNTDPDYVSEVPLEFAHLFTAFSVAAKNDSDNIDITVVSIGIEGLMNSRSAKITYTNAGDGEYPVVEYDKEKNDNPDAPDYSYSPSVKLTSGLIDMSTKTSDRDYFMSWPMSLDEADNVILTVNYRVDDGTEVESKEIPLSGIQWVAGTKNNINITFRDKEVKLICVVEPWEKETEEIDYSQDVVSVSKKMTWEGVQEVNYETGEVILKSDEKAVATCSFRIDTPIGATWTASLILVNEDGSIDAFSWVDDTKYGIVGTGKDSVIKLKVNNNAPKAPQHICILRITVQTSDMRTIVVNDLVPEKYTDEHGIEHSTNGYTEFRIIQNDILG